jgi:hypothetical protein
MLGRFIEAEENEDEKEHARDHQGAVDPTPGSKNK